MRFTTTLPVGILLLLWMPTAGAYFVFNHVDDLERTADDPHVPLIVPCLDLHVALDDDAYTGRFPQGCRAIRPIALTWHTDVEARRAQGLLTYTARAEDADALVHEVTSLSVQARVLPPGPLARLRAWLDPAPAPAHATLRFASPLAQTREAEVRIEAGWDVHWELDGCRSAAGSVWLIVNGERAHLSDPAFLLGAICLASARPAPAPADAARLAATLLDPVRHAAIPAFAFEAIASPRLEIPLASTPELPRGDALLHARAREGAATSLATSGSAQASAAQERAHASVHEVARLATPAATVEQELAAEAVAPLMREPSAGDASGPAPASRELPAAPAPARDDPAREPARDPLTPATTAPPRSLPASSARPPASPLVAQAQKGPVPIDPAPPLLRIVVGAVALLVAAFALYQRFARPEALSHTGRQALYDACVASDAPRTAGELARACGTQRKTAEYHLTYLVRLGLLRIHEAPDEPRRYAAAMVRGAPAGPSLDARLLAALGASPGLSVSALATLTGATRPRAQRHLRSLVLDGRVVTDRGEGARTYRLADARSPA